ncbi:PKD-like family protein [bacterium A37T11]|nr:PKD-like family protein [bacterium A37T11]
MNDNTYKKSLLLLMSVLLLTIGSCKDENYRINAIPDITIAPLTVTDKSIGDTVKLSSTVDYGGQTANFSYKWYKYVTLPNYTQVLKLISEEKDFVAVMDSLGTYQLREEVTNTATGITAASLTTWNVVSRAERGWYVLKATVDGNTEMDGFLLSGTTIVSTPHLLSEKYGQALSGEPIGLTFTSAYNYLDPVSNKFTPNNSCLIAVSQKEIIAYRIKDEKVLANTDRLFYEVPAAASRNFAGIISDPKLMVVVNNGHAHGMNPASNSFLPERLGAYNLSPYFTIPPHLTSTDAGYILGFDQENESFVTVRYQQTGITYFPDEYLPSPGGNAYQISSNHLGGKLEFLENTDGSLDTLLTTNGRAYALLQPNAITGKVLLGLNLAELVPTQHNGAHSPIRYADTLLASHYPDLVNASYYTLHKGQPILYFSYQNKLGSYQIESKNYLNQLHSFDPGEEITYLKYLDCQYDSPTSYNFSRLVVATYSNGKYKIYQFSVLGNSLHQEGPLLQGEGKVKSLIYSSPATTAFFNALYRYY